MYAAIGEDGPAVQWWAAGRGLALDVVRGLHFLHKGRVRHGDLKSSNILLTADRRRAKIGDVGLAKVLSTATTAAPAGGTYVYAAPEVLLNTRCDEKSDMYSYGIILHELATLGRPQRGAMRPVAVPAEAPAAVASLIARLLDPDPDARPTAREAFDIIWESPETREQEEARLAAEAAAGSDGPAGGGPASLHSAAAADLDAGARRVDRDPPS